MNTKKTIEIDMTAQTVTCTTEGDGKRLTTKLSAFSDVHTEAVAMTALKAVAGCVDVGLLRETSQIEEVVPV